MTPATVGFTPQQLVPRDALLRLTFVRDTGLFSADFGYDLLFDTWPSKMTDTWSRLPYQAQLFPIVSASVGPNATATTLDARNNAARTGTDLIAAVAHMAAPGVALSRVELLTGAARTAATTSTGAAARDATTADAKQQQDETGLAADLKAWLDKFSSAAKWTAAGVVVVLLLLVLFRAEK